MKRKLFLGTSVAIALTLGVLLLPLSGWQAFAETSSNDQQIAQEQVVDEASTCEADGDCESVADYAADLVKSGVISQAEADRLIENEQKTLAIYEEMAKVEAAFDEKLEKLYAEVQDVYDKIERVEEKNYYNEFAQNNILTAAEIEQLKAVDEQLNKLYEREWDDASAGQLEAEEAEIYRANQAIFDKIDAFYEQQWQRESDEMYQVIAKEAGLTDEQVNQLKAVDAKVDQLIESAADDMSDAEWQALDAQIDALYQELDFLDALGVDEDAVE